MNTVYVLEKYLIDEHLSQVMKRLYSEDRLTGDNMRDLAQRLQEVVDHSIEVNEDCIKE